MARRAGAGIGNIGELHARLGDFETAARYTSAALDAAIRRADPDEQQIRLVLLANWR